MRAERGVRAVALALALCAAGLAQPREGAAITGAARSSNTTSKSPRSVSTDLNSVRKYRERNETAILAGFVDLLRLPNLASDSVAIRRNADTLVSLLKRRGMIARRLELPGSPPAVYAELPAQGATRTITLYAHYDGQPVNPRDWAGDPWTPVLRDRPVEQGGKILPWPGRGDRIDPEWRLYARSAGDDKAPIVALLAALDALNAQSSRRSVNLKVFLEGEEEAGSTHLAAMLAAHRDELRSDAWIFCDGPMHPSRRPQLVFGARGVMGLELTVYGPLRALHSGHYGNWAPNPIARMTDLLASLRDGDGRIKVPGFDRDVRPLTDAEHEAMAAVPDPDSSLAAELELGGTEAGGARLIQRIMLPAINFRGVRGGAVGEGAANAIPTEARASIDFRLVPDQTPGAVRASIEDYLQRQGWFLVSAAPDSATRRKHDRIVRLDWGEGYAAYRVPLDSPLAAAVRQSMEQSLNKPVLMTPMLGGSLPLATFEQALGVPIIVLPIANHDDNQHAANENLRIQNLRDGIDVFAGLLLSLGALWK
jgi:acetylornithine deacetylase/succinyl-diaminopimelate desuccinylase-like protein